MAWYTDEQYEMIKDSREKKSIAASAFKQRTHCGKGGSVKFPSDYLSAKELKAMNGECKSYRMNDPMNWEEFKAMPEDLQVCYIKALRKKYGVPDARLADAMGVARVTFGKYIRCLGLGQGKSNAAKGRWWDDTEFLAWWHGLEPVKTDKANEETVEVETLLEEVTEAVNDISATESDEDTLVAVNEEAEIVVNEDPVGPVDEAAVEEILAFIGEVAAEVQKDLYPEDVKVERCTLEEEMTDRVEALLDEVSKFTTGEQKATDEPNPGPIAFTGHYMPVIPKKGSMTFECNDADDALATIKCLLSNAKVNLTISWECVF